MRQKVVLIHQATQPIAWYKVGAQILLGCLYIALLSQIEIPLQPIPVTLQTFAIFSLALFQGGKKAFFSLLLYLFAATIGLPVFPSACSDPLWILDPSAGYCLSFPLAAYVAGRFTEFKPYSAAWMTLGLICAEFIIYFIGVTWLSFMIGWQQALTVGFYPFVLFGIIKLFAAISVKMASKPIIQYFQDEIFA